MGPWGHGMCRKLVWDAYDEAVNIVKERKVYVDFAFLLTTTQPSNDISVRKLTLQITHIFCAFQPEKHHLQAKGANSLARSILNMKIRS